MTPISHHSSKPSSLALIVQQATSWSTDAFCLTKSVIHREARVSSQGLILVHGLKPSIASHWSWIKSKFLTVVCSVLCDLAPWPFIFILFIFFFVYHAAAKSLQLCPTLCDPIDGSPSGSPVPGILQGRTREWVAISFSTAWKWKVKGKSLSRVRLLATPWTAAHQAPLCMGFSRQEYWSGVPLCTMLGHIDWPFCCLLISWTHEAPFGLKFSYLHFLLLGMLFPKVFVRLVSL